MGSNASARVAFVMALLVSAEERVVDDIYLVGWVADGRHDVYLP